MDLNLQAPGVLIEPNPGTGLEPNPGQLLEPNPGIDNSAEPAQSAPSGLLAQALGSARAATVRASDMQLRGPTRGTRAATLWMWASSVRINAVVREVMHALRFAHGAWWLQPAIDANGTAGVPALRLLTVQAPGLTRLQSQLRLVIDCADERPDRLAEILVQARSLWPFWSAITNVVPGQTPRSAELMAVVQAVTSHLGHAFKQSLAVPRPVDLSALVQPCITTPGHGSLPSGHAMAAFVAVRLLRDLLPSSIAGGGIDTVGIALDRTARRIAANRVVAGLHYPIDNSAGWCVAESAFDTLRMLAGRATAVPGHRAFDADGTTIEELPAADAPLTDAAVGSTLTPQAGNPPTSSSPLLKILWDAADEELTRLQLN